MSAANAAAKKRRAMNPPPSSPFNENNTSHNENNTSQSDDRQPVSNGQPGGFTLQQVIAVIDKRLVNLEKGMADIKNNPTVHSEESNTPINNTQSQEIYDCLDEYNSRFEILTQEINELKHIIINLQSYTMDVNKMLLEEKQFNNQINLQSYTTMDIDKMLLEENEIDIEKNS